MNITIVDGPPGIGVSRGLREMSAMHGYNKTVIVPEFANVAMSNSRLHTSNLSWALAGSIQELINTISDAEEKGASRLILGGSPVSYRSLAQVRKGNHIDVGAFMQYEDIMRATASHTEILLLRPTKDSDYSPNMVKILSPKDIPKFVDTLSEEYERLFGKVRVQDVSLIGDKLTLQRH